MSAPGPSTPTSEQGWSAASGRASSIFDWLITLGLAATFTWTTLCLGGYRPETMVVTSNAIFALAALGGVWLLIQPRRLNPAVLWPVPFLLYSLASTLWLAPAQWLAWREWLLWLQMWLVFALTLHFVRNRVQTAVVASTFAVLGVVGSLMAIHQRFQDPHWLMLGRTQADQFIGRSSGMFGIPNSLAALLELMIPACVTLLWSRATSLTARIGCAALAVLFILALILTGSRGGWISLTLALALWPLSLGGRWWKKAIGVALIVLLAAIACAALYRYSPYAHERIQPFLDGRFESSRPIIWRAGVQIWQAQPWLGTGAASFNVLFDQYRPKGFLDEPLWSHNDYLNTLGDYGVVGFALWFGAGAVLLGLAWRTIAREKVVSGGARSPDGLKQSSSEGNLSRGQVPPAWHLATRYPLKLGLWFGCFAFLLHLTVDFHTKIPALAFAFALVLALLLRRDENPSADRPTGVVDRLAVAVALLVVLLFGVGHAWPLYRAEALRYKWRQQIDRIASGRAKLEEVVVPAREAFATATRIDPANARAWSDLAYAMMLAWHVDQGSTGVVGRSAAPVADRAIALGPLVAEFWVRKGVALDMQAQPEAAEECFTRALALAPNSPEWHYYHAYHLSTIAGRKSDALTELANCLALDPGNSQAVALRARLQSSR